MLEFLSEQAIYSYVSSYAYLTVFISVLVDSFPVTGAFTPEETILAIFGFFAHSIKDLNMFCAILLVMSGYGIGQTINYYLGYKYGDRIIEYLKILSKIKKDINIEEIVEYVKHFPKFRYALMSGSSIVRGIYAISKGTQKMEFSSFIMFELLIGFIRSSLYLFIGYFFGQTLEGIESLIMRIAVVVSAFTIFGLISSIIEYKKMKDQNVLKGTGGFFD